MVRIHAAGGAKVGQLEFIASGLNALTKHFQRTFAVNLALQALTESASGFVGVAVLLF